MTFPSGKIIMVNWIINLINLKSNVNIRPYLLESIQRLRQKCEVIIFTSSHYTYADIIINYLDPKRELFDKRLYRSSCVLSHEELYLKDLRIFQNCRNLKNLILIDNAAYSFGFQLDNGIPIIPFYENKLDTELRDVTDFILEKLVDVDDVRPVLRKELCLRRI